MVVFKHRQTEQTISVALKYFDCHLDWRVLSSLLTALNQLMGGREGGSLSTPLTTNRPPGAGHCNLHLRGVWPSGL